MVPDSLPQPVAAQKHWQCNGTKQTPYLNLLQLSKTVSSGTNNFKIK